MQAVITSITMTGRIHIRLDNDINKVKADFVRSVNPLDDLYNDSG